MILLIMPWILLHVLEDHVKYNNTKVPPINLYNINTPIGLYIALLGLMKIKEEEKRKKNEA